jgi:hypothetical protein
MTSSLTLHAPEAGNFMELIVQYRRLAKIFLVINSRIRWAGNVARIGERRDVYRGLVGKPEGSRPVGRPRRRWKDSTRIDHREVRCGGMEWIELAQDRDRWRALGMR